MSKVQMFKKIKGNFYPYSLVAEGFVRTTAKGTEKEALHLAAKHFSMQDDICIAHVLSQAN